MSTTLAKQPLARRKRTGTKYPNLHLAAKAMGVHRITLFRALEGTHPNAILTSGYYAFIGRGAVAA